MVNNSKSFEMGFVVLVLFLLSRYYFPVIEMSMSLKAGVRREQNQNMNKHEFVQQAIK